MTALVAHARRAGGAGPPGPRATPGPGIDPARPVAFLCAEYGVHVSLPVYSGGLGALAGDLLKEASDRAVPMVAVGLMYRKGYFRQRIDGGGWQHEYWIDTDPQRLPAARVTTADGCPLTIEVPIYGVDVVAHIWRVEVGRVPLFLLDTDISRNAPVERWITARLYEADPTTRLAQYVLLGRRRGPCAARARDRPERDPPQRGPRRARAAGARRSARVGGRSVRRADRAAALDQARARTVFTTHTPVPAGNDSYPPEQVERPRSQGSRTSWRCSPDELIALGRTHPDDAGEPFGVTQAALRHEPRRQRRQPPPRRGRPRDVGGAVARATADAGPDRSRHQRRSRPDLDRRSDARAARPPPRRGLDGARRRPADMGGGRPDPGRRAVGGARAPAHRDWSSSSARAARRTGCCAATCASTSTPRRVCSTTTCSRSASRGASRPTSGSTCSRATPNGRCRCSAASDRCRWCSPARRIRATRRPSTRSSACSALKSAQVVGRAGRVPRRLRPGDRGDARARLRRMAERARGRRSRRAARAG